jgi:hypothetical protein
METRRKKTAELVGGGASSGSLNRPVGLIPIVVAGSPNARVRQPRQGSGVGVGCAA